MTYHSGEAESAIDVTLSIGICDNYQNKWRVIEDELRSSHSGILLEVGGSPCVERTLVIDWSKFDWEKYQNKSKLALTSLVDEWKKSDISVDEKAVQIQTNLSKLVEEIATKKTISNYSRPWFNQDLSAKLAELRELRKKFLRHRSMRNKKSYEDLRENVVGLLEMAKEEWKIMQCEKIANAPSIKKNGN